MAVGAAITPSRPRTRPGMSGVTCGIAFSCKWARNRRHAPFGASTVGQYRELPGTVKAGQLARAPRIPPDSYAPLSANTLWLRQAIADVDPSIGDCAPEIDEGETGDRGIVPPGRVE